MLLIYFFVNVSSNQHLTIICSEMSSNRFDLVPRDFFAALTRLQVLYVSPTFIIVIYRMLINAPCLFREYFRPFGATSALYPIEQAYRDRFLPSNSISVLDPDTFATLSSLKILCVPQLHIP